MSLACVLMSAGSASAHGGQDDPIHSGYLRIYAGDAAGASRHFETLHTGDPRSLAAWFGLLVSQAARIELEESLVPAFEQGVQTFIDHADERYTRSRADAEALFFLAQSLMLRSVYRFNFDKGLWGAARDAARAKGLAEEYIKQYPGHGDAYLTLGLYNYYVDIAPVWLRQRTPVTTARPSPTNPASIGPWPPSMATASKPLHPHAGTGISAKRQRQAEGWRFYDCAGWQARSGLLAPGKDQDLVDEQRKISSKCSCGFPNARSLRARPRRRVRPFH